MNPSKFIVTTTISEPTEATLKFLQRDDWSMIVVGDLKTPHRSYRELEKKFPRLTYLAPEDQEALDKELSDAIGWNKIMRRNFGFMKAWKLGAEIVATVDDDNIPYDNWGKKLFVGRCVEADLFTPENGVFDPLSVVDGAKHLWHRGYPGELLPTRGRVVYRGKTRRKVLIQADLWDGVPDIDGVERMLYAPRLKLSAPECFCSDCIAPFNSQNTFISREALPYYMVLPHVGRMDDIWGGYLVQKQFPGSLVFGPVTVYQDRNEPHARNLKDIRDEMIGYEHSLGFIRGEFELPDDASRAYSLYRKFFR